MEIVKLLLAIVAVTAIHALVLRLLSGRVSRQEREVIVPSRERDRHLAVTVVSLPGSRSFLHEEEAVTISGSATHLRARDLDATRDHGAERRPAACR